jgi:carbohydrate diacid regulator
MASGDKSRVNSFHKGAKLAAFEKKEVIVEDKDLSSYEGCRKGINSPIYHNDEVLNITWR